MSNEFILSLGLIFISSISGSFHCAGMCGGFSCIISKTSKATYPIVQICMYHVGRLLTYSTLSIIMYSSTTLLQKITKSNLIIYLTISTCVLLLIGDIWKDCVSSKSTLYNISIKNTPSIIKKISDGLSTYFSYLYSGITQDETPIKSLSIGMLTGLIPCGWLYIYVALAGTQESSLHTFLTIVSFWLGTLPALVITGILGAKISDTIFPRIKYFSRILLLIVAIISIHTRFPFLTKTDMSSCDFCISGEPK